MTRRFEAKDFFEITGRGMVYTGIEPNPPLELGEEIDIVVTLRGTIAGLERHPIAGSPRPGYPVGVALNLLPVDG